MASEKVHAVAAAMAQGGHFALGGKGGAPDLIRELDKRGWSILKRKEQDMSPVSPDPETKKLPVREQKLQELNLWIGWLEEWKKVDPNYLKIGPMQETEGIRRLTNFLRGIAYDWPLR